MAISALRSAARHRAAAASVARSLLNPAAPRVPYVSRLRTLLPLVDRTGGVLSCSWTRCLSTSRTASSLNDPSPNWSNRPPKETILLDGCDFEHWLVVMDNPDPNFTRDEIIKLYIQTLAKIVGSEEEARMKMYSVSTKHYFAFGALVSEELSLKLKELPGVRWVLPDSYLDVKNKDYGGEPFINGEAVPYDPKYHEEWVRNNARAQERNRRNDRTRDRSRNFERRRENMQNFQNRPPPPPPLQNQEAGSQAVQHGAVPPTDVSRQASPTTIPNAGPGGYQHQMPGQNHPAPSMGGPNRSYGGYQNSAPNFPGGVSGNAYQGGPPPPGPGPYQGGPASGSGSGAYQGGSPTPGGGRPYYGGPPSGGGSYQGVPPPAGSGPYQGGPPSGSGPYQGGPPPTGSGSYQGAPPAVPGPYRGGPPQAGGPYQGGGPSSYQGQYQGGNTQPGNRNAYQGPGGYQPPSANQGPPGGFQGPTSNYQGNPVPYQGASSNYQGYQGAAFNHQGNSDGREGNAGPYQAGSIPRDVPGRDD